MIDRLRVVRVTVSHENRRRGNPLSDDELEDLIQDTLTAIWGKLDQFEGYGRLEAWFCRFAVMEFRGRWKKIRRRSAYHDSAPHDPASIAAEDRAKPSWTREELYQGLESLGPPDSRIIAWKTLEGLTFDDIAARLSWSSNTVKTRYYRGLRKLRARLIGRSQDLVSEGEQ